MSCTTTTNAGGLNNCWVLILSAAILRNPRDLEPLISDEKIATFYAVAELNVRFFFFLNLETKC